MSNLYCIDDVLNLLDELKDKLEAVRRINEELRDAESDASRQLSEMGAELKDLEQRCTDLANDLALANARIVELEAAGES